MQQCISEQKTIGCASFKFSSSGLNIVAESAHKTHFICSKVELAGKRSTS